MAMRSLLLGCFIILLTLDKSKEVIPMSRTFVLGEEFIQLLCVTSSPEERFPGFKRANGLPINPYTNYKKYAVQGIKNGYNLIIYNLEWEDVDEYYCNSSSGITKHIVKMNPTFHPNTDNLYTVFYGEDAEILPKFWWKPPLTSIKWLLNGRNFIQYDHRSGNVIIEATRLGRFYGFNKTTGGLIIRNITFIDDNTYVMKILQQLPMWQSKMVYVNVKAKPSIIKEKTHVVQPFDSASYQVRCVAHGLPIPQISFYDDKDEILNDVQTQTFDDEKLREALVTVSDPNEYVQCIAKNQYAETSWKVNIPADVMFGNISEVQNLVKGVQGSIKIELTGDDLPNLKWEKFDKVNSRYNLILTYNKETKEVRYENDHRTEYNFDKRNGNLIIEQASTKDVTLFKATIQDWIKWRSKTIDVDVGVPATLIMDESHIIKPVGHKLFEIQCAGTGTPSLNIIFQDDKGSMIDKGGLTMSTYTFMKHSVVLRSSVLTSFVECIVKNKYGQDSLRIEIPNSVSFGDISTIQNLQSGTNGTIKVDIKTNKMPDTKWEKLDVTSKQYVEILSYKNPFKSVTYGDDSKANRYQFDEQHGHLIIKNVKPDDIGSYKISVNGNFGWISKIITINTNNPKSSMLGGSTIFGVSKILLGCIGGIKLLTITATIYFCCLKKRLNAHAQNEYEDVENLIQEKKEKKKKANDNDGLFESDKDEIKSGEDEIEFGENEIEVGDGEIEAGEGDDAYRRMHKEKETKASDRKDDDVTLRHFSEDQQDSKKKKRSKRHRSEPHSDLKDDDVTLRHSSDDQQHYKKKKRSKSHRSEPRSDNDNHERKKHGAENSSKNKKRSSEKSNNKEKRSRSRRHEDSHL